jgi:hypothetical protein
MKARSAACDRRPTELLTVAELNAGSSGPSNTIVTLADAGTSAPAEGDCFCGNACANVTHGITIAMAMAAARA